MSAGAGGAVLVSVTGGTGGTTAHLDDLHRLARLCARVAEELAAAAWRCHGLCADADLLLSAPLAPGTAAQAEASVLACVVGPDGALGVGASLAALAGALEAAAWSYEQVERAVARLWQGADFGGGCVLGLLAPPAAGGAGLVLGVAWLRLRSDPALAGATHTLLLQYRRLDGPLQHVLTSHTGLAQHLADGAGGVLTGVFSWAGPAGSLLSGGRGTPLTTRQAAADLARFFSDGDERVRGSGRWVAVPPGQPGADASSLAGLLVGLQSTAGSGDGRLEVRRVTSRRPDGTATLAYLVDVPGTDDWSLPPAQWTSDRARDLGGDLRLAAGEPTAYQRGIVRALSRAGVPSGSTVAFVGHSQGGMAALAVAADPAVRARYHVTHVITAGSPVARMAHPPGVTVLALENTGDLVPALDGAENPDRTDEVTARFADDRHAVAANHDLQRYVEGAAALDRSRDPSVREVLGSLREAGVLAGDGPATTVESSSWVVTARRPPT